MLTLIKNGYVIDPSSNLEGTYDMLIEGNQIREISVGITPVDGINIQVIDATGSYIMPGFIDLHVHLREPGYEYKETIKTGSMAAAAGGFTTICAMPNTKPTVDSADRVLSIIQKAREDATVNVLPIGTVTLGQEGLQLADIKAMKEAGAVAISEDGKSVMDTALYWEAMSRASECNIPVFAHCEEKSLAGNGVINAGHKAKALNLPGICNAVEDIITARDILLAKESGARLHLCHISTRVSVRMLALAKQEGITVTGEVCPHHFTLTDKDIPGDNSNYKMNPPLRSSEDLKAIKEALRNGTIDVIATDHAPHSLEEKEKSFRDSPFGIVGLETAFALTYTELVRSGILSLKEMVEKLSTNPAKILGMDRGKLQVGNIADLVIVDLNQEYKIDRNTFLSLGKNTPFHGRTVWGRILHTLVNGKIVYNYKQPR